MKIRKTIITIITTKTIRTRTTISRIITRATNNSLPIRETADGGLFLILKIF